MEGNHAQSRRSRGIERAARRWRRAAGEVVRREGADRLLARAGVVVRGAVYRYVVFVALDLASPPPEVPSGSSFEMRLATLEDIAAYARFRGAELDAVPVERRLREGHVCIAAWRGGEIVSAAWYAFGLAWMDEIDRALQLADDEIYVYDSYTTESRRGEGIAAVRGRWAVEHFRAKGFRRTIGWISPQNRPAFGPGRKLGAVTLGRAGFVRLGPWRRDFVEPEGGERRWAARGEPIVIERDFGAPRRR